MGFSQLSEQYSDPSYDCDLPVMTMVQRVDSMDLRWPTERPGLHRFFTQPDEAIEHA